jgi:transcriptional regulator with XRE-family HTH domain
MDRKENGRRMQNLKWLRKQKALSLTDLSQRARISPVTINRIENGKQKPRPRTIRELARALEVRVEDLTSEQGVLFPRTNSASR